MGDAFRLGGWGMYPTAIAGLVLIFCALRYASAPDAMRALVVRRLSILTFLAGALGTCAGVIKTCTHAQLGDVVVGIGESLNCVGLALMTLVIAGIASTIGAARKAAPDAELTDPHA
jgi:hypothetical protein